MFFHADTDIFLKRIQKVVSNHFLHQDFFYFQIHDKIFKQIISLGHFWFSFSHVQYSSTASNSDVLSLVDPAA